MVLENSYLFEKNDQKLRYCFKCKSPTRSKIYKCYIDKANPTEKDADICGFEFVLCKAHKYSKNKVFKKHVEEEHYSIEIV